MKTLIFDFDGTLADSFELVLDIAYELTGLPRQSDVEVTRLRQLGHRIVPVFVMSAGLRGAYHLYQGVGAFVGNAVMGVIFALFYIRFRRVLPLVVAHTILDVASFVGYALLKDQLTFLR